MIPHCPHCHQPLMLRLGVRLPLLKVRIFDAIKAAGEMGITSRDLRQLIYGKCADEITLTTVRMHCQQINEYLYETEWRIRCPDRRHWQLIKLKRKREQSREATQACEG